MFLDINFNFINQMNTKYIQPLQFVTSYSFQLSKKAITWCKCNWPEMGSFFRIFSHSTLCLCQVEGHGGTLSKFSLKFVQNFPLHFWKILCFLISLCGPLSNGIWILDSHPSIKTLAFLDHCVDPGPRGVVNFWPPKAAKNFFTPPGEPFFPKSPPQ